MKGRTSGVCRRVTLEFRMSGLAKDRRVEDVSSVCSETISRWRDVKKATFPEVFIHKPVFKLDIDREPPERKRTLSKLERSHEGSLYRDRQSNGRIEKKLPVASPGIAKGLEMGRQKMGEGVQIEFVLRPYLALPYESNSMPLRSARKESLNSFEDASLKRWKVVGWRAPDDEPVRS